MGIGDVMMAQAGAPWQYRGDAMLTATYIHNRIPTSVTGGKSPIEALTGNKPDLSKLKVWFSKAFVSIPKEVRRKDEMRGRKFVFVRYLPNGYLFYDPRSRREFKARDAKFISRWEQFKFAVETMRSLQQH